ncbi:DUF7573 domain-containing protein [Halovenus halobia]|uniref:DUF7573 domain-containing protein n=1 Tax=Halovenus halobia TaxID=3396622 RepID=UPI003F557C2A
MSDRSLDDFAADSEETDTEDSDETAEAGEPDEQTVDPAVATSTLHSDGIACESCGESVRRRWLDDGAYVCAECKEW